MLMGLCFRSATSFEHQISKVPVASSDILRLDMGVSENSVANDPTVLLIIIPIKWLFHWGINPTFSDKPTLESLE